MGTQYVITAVNMLTNHREEISRPMDREEAELRLKREIENRKYQRWKSHKRLRIEQVQPVQMTINFDESV